MSRNVFESPAIINRFQAAEETEKWDRLSDQTGYSEEELKTLQIIESKMERDTQDHTHEQWDETQEEYLQKSYGYMDTEEIAENLGRTKSAVYDKARELDVSAVERSERTWSAEEEDYLRDNYEDQTAGEIAAALGKTESSVYSKVYRMRDKGEW